MSEYPVVGGQVPRRGNAATRVLGRAVLGAMGWRVEGEMPDLSRFVIAVAPHTSNWDFVVGAGAMFALDLQVSFLSKHTLFRWPFRTVLRWMGAIAVDRSAPHGVVGASVAAFGLPEPRILAIAPEGTRRRGGPFKAGFLHIARGARVPVMLASLDYAARCVRMGPTFDPGEDVEADRRRTEAFFASVRGKRSAQSA